MELENQFCNHHSKGCLGQESMDANLGEGKFDEEQYVCIVSERFLTDFLLVAKGKIAAIQ